MMTRLQIFFLCAAVWAQTDCAQSQSDWKLAKMPSDLETDFALSALPPNVRAGATVYLLDPEKGYYVGRQGTNGFVCLISRGEWEWGEYRNDLAAPMGFDPEGARTTVRVYLDQAAMRASGKYTAARLKDTMIARIQRGVYEGPKRAGICYMLAPEMRVYTGNPGDDTVKTMSMPHYMFYAPYITDSDAGTNRLTIDWPYLVNPGNTVLGPGKGPFGYYIMPANTETTKQIRQEGMDLMKRLAAWEPFMKVPSNMNM